jgi:hypothetical protein
MTFKKITGFLEVLFGVGFGGGDAGKSFVEDADDSPLFGERRERDGNLPKASLIELRDREAGHKPRKVRMAKKIDEPIIQ